MSLRLNPLHSKWDMKNVMKQGVDCPLLIEDMINQIKNLTYFCTFFFKEASFAFRFLIVFNDRNKIHLTIMESAQYCDK